MQRIRGQHEQAIATAGRVALAILISAMLHLAMVARLDLTVARPLPQHLLEARLNLEPVPPVTRVRHAGKRHATATPALNKAAPVFAGVAALAPAATSDRSEEGSDTAPAVIVAAAPSAAIAVPVDLVYYAARELDVYPMPLSALTPPQAPEAGRVQLLTMIDETGAVTAAEVFDAEPMGRFDSDAVAIVSAVRFSPARKDGVPVRSRVLIELMFSSQSQE